MKPHERCLGSRFPLRLDLSSNEQSNITRDGQRQGAAEEDAMANFGHHLGYPTPDWVAFRREEEIGRARVERRSARPLALFVSALRRFARSWATAQAHNAFL
jgi:hypothetical protein